ncbi:hypothetical protein SUDANB58_02592 [Streptomyces sp. enrichment culture]|uniref:hypothetical protein n=1 Tax=Streptomyces sp. enrichment culture TaxID=1795815 RepID=UPI003F578DF2
MSAVTISLAPAPGRASGATTTAGGRRHRLGDALRAVRVFAGAAFDVVVLGECGEYGEHGGEAGVRRR